MKSFTRIIGIVMIIGGIFLLAYQGISYTKEKKIAEIGPIQIKQETKEIISFPPLLGGLCLISGFILVFISRK